MTPTERPVSHRVLLVADDEAVLREARVLLGIEQIELAKRARVAVGTIRRMESFAGEIGARTSTLSQVQATLEKAGIEFLNDERPGVRVTALRREPHRAAKTRCEASKLRLENPTPTSRPGFQALRSCCLASRSRNSLSR
jgi:transcriptional regulator with XRE-family HTH domain